MIGNIKKLLNIASGLAIGSLILWSCESEADRLGEQFFQNGAQGVEKLYSIIGYNNSNHDTIRTDAQRLQLATLGAFYEPQFGLQKSAYVTQLRLVNYAPDFGTNPVLDSAVLTIKPSYPTDSITTTTTEDYIYPIDNVPAKKVVNTYPVTKYGKTKIGGNTVFKIKVHEVTDFLGSNSDKIFSDKDVATSTLLGSKTFDGKINSVKITKDSDNSSIIERSPSIRIKLDSAFFQNKIIKKGSSPELADAASFIRYIRGLKLSVDENDGYLFNFDPNSMGLTLYYKKDQVDNGVTTRVVGDMNFDLGTSNTHFNQNTFIRTGTALASALAAGNTTLGDPKLFAQGMGGPGIGLRIPATTIAEVKNMYKNEKIGIISAKIRLYTDVANWSNNLVKPENFVVKQRKVNADGTFEDFNAFLTDMKTLAYAPSYQLVKSFNLKENPAYYEIGITQTFKNIIEQEADNYDIVLNVGDYTKDANGNLLGFSYADLGAQNFNTRSYSPQRAVFVGTLPETDPMFEKSVKLVLTFGKK